MMEPSAPGTEGNKVFNQEFKPTKKDAAEEEDLSKKAILPNGTYGNIFIREYVNGSRRWFCRVCDKLVRGHVFNHEAGKKHVQRLTLGGNNWFCEVCEAFAFGEISEHKISKGHLESLKLGENGNKKKDGRSEMVAAPGQPPPPGFEGEMEESRANIQDRLDEYKAGPLVGLEYLLELLNYDESMYMCILCHKKGDPRTILTHLASYNHQLRYLQKHFPTAFHHISPFMGKPFFKRNLNNAILKIADAIEATFGRMKPIQVETTEYNKNQGYFEEMVAKGKHFSELSGHTFENVVTKEELITYLVTKEELITYDKIAVAAPPVVNNPPEKRSLNPPVVTKPIKRPKIPVGNKMKNRSLSPVSDVSSGDLEDFDPKKQKKLGKSNRRKAAVDINPYLKIEGNMSWQKSSIRRDRPPPLVDRKRDEKMKEFKSLAKAIDNQMNQVLKERKENPEKHPKYNDEWKQFWNSRYKELQAEGKNAATHDFKSEWIEWWNKRMLELHQEEVKSSKVALRKRLGLPDEPAPISFKIGERKKPQNSSNKPIPVAAPPEEDPEVIVIDDTEEDTSIMKESPKRDKFERMRVKSEERSRSRGKSREISWERERESRGDHDEKHRDRPNRYPWENEHHYPFNSNPYPPPKVPRDVTRKPVMNQGSSFIHSQEKEVIEDDGEVNVVDVLRLLTALEERLGSLGPKVIDLLVQALVMEKKVANSSEELLDSEMNCVLFETVKEKLKGQLQAGLVSRVQEKAYKTSIKKTAGLIHIASERKKQKEQELPKKPVVVPGVGKVDRGKIARQIANALIAQGKTDVTKDELEELINAVVGIAEAQKNSLETLTTASFLEKLSSLQSTETQKVEPKVDPKRKVDDPEPNEKQPARKLEEDLEASSGSQDKTSINMEGLSDCDLETLLQNFKDLSSEEQLGLINYLKKLECKEPERVEKLRKFVNLSEGSDEENGSGRYSPFSVKMKDIPFKKENAEKKNDERVEENNSGLVNIDSEDEYSFEDVAKAVSQKVKENEKEKEQKRLENKNLDAKAFITSLMSSLNKNVSNPTTNSLLSPSVTTFNKRPMEKINVISNIPVSSVDIAKSLSGITMSVSSLGNILGNVQSLTSMSQAGEHELKLNTELEPPNLSNIPLDPTSITRMPFDEFDILRQQDSKKKPELNAPGLIKSRTNKSYDEFNIGPIPQEVKDDIRDVRIHDSSYMRLPDKPIGYSDPPSFSNSQFPNRLPQPDPNVPFPNIQRTPIRGNAIQDQPSTSFPNQYPQRGESCPNKFRTGGNNFESGDRGYFGPRGTDFREGMSDARRGMGNLRGMTTEYRAGLNEYRDRSNDYRDKSNDYRDAPTDYRDAPNDYRNSLNDYREASNNYRDPPNDAPNDFRGGKSSIRGSDFRDMRVSQGAGDGPRHKGDFKSGFGYPRGGQPPKVGNFSYDNRPNYFSPPPRYPQSNNYNSFNKR